MLAQPDDFCLSPAYTDAQEKLCGNVKRTLSLIYESVWMIQVCLNITNAAFLYTDLTRSSATAEKQCVSYTWLPGLVIWPSDDHTWRFKAQNTTESQRLCYFVTFKRSDSKNAGRKRILAWNSQSRSFILQSFARQRAEAHRHVILLAVGLHLRSFRRRSEDPYIHVPYISRN